MPKLNKQQFANNAAGEIVDSISATSTTIKLSTAHGDLFPSLDTGEYFYATIDDGTNNEVVRVTARSSVFPAPPTGSENYCQRLVYHVNNTAEVNSIVYITVKEINTNRVDVTIESANSDPVDSVVVQDAGESSQTSFSYNSIYTVTLNYTSGHPTTKSFNILWSKASIAGMWMISGETYHMSNTCSPTAYTYTVTRNADSTGSYAFAANTDIEQRVTGRTLFDVQRPNSIHKSHLNITEEAAFGWAENADRLEGGNLDYSKMAENYSLTFGTISNNDAGQTMYNKSPGAVVLGMGCINHGNGTGGFTAGVRSMVGVDGATQEATCGVAMGFYTNAYRFASAAFNANSQAFGQGSFAAGHGAVASDAWANIALGQGVTTPVVDNGDGTYSTFDGCTAVGRWNKYDDNKHYVFSVGVGEDATDRFNGFYIRQTTTNWATGTGALLGPSGVGFPTLGKSSRYLSDSGAGSYGVLSGELWVDTSGYVRIKS